MRKIDYHSELFSSDENPIIGGYAIISGDTKGHWERYKILPFSRHFFSISLEGQMIVRNEGEKDILLPDISIKGCALKPYYFDVKGRWKQLVIGTRASTFYKRFHLPLKDIQWRHVPLSKYNADLHKDMKQRIHLRGDSIQMIHDLINIIGNNVKEERSGLDIDEVIDVHNKLGKSSVAKLSQHYGMNRSKFDREFFKVMGAKPGAFFKLLRILNVLQELTVDSGLTIEELSRKYGYTDHSHLIKHMRNHLGVSPKEFKKLNEPLIQVPLAELPKGYYEYKV